MEKIILNFLNQLASLNPQEEEIVKESFVRKTYRAKEYLLKAGEVCDSLYFIETGLVRVSLLNQKSEDITFNFRDQHQFVTDYESFLKVIPASFFIQALEDVSCLEISKDKFVTMCQTIRAGELITRKIVDNLYVEFKQRLLSFYQATPEERYLDLFEKMPSLVNRVPQSYLASYIGVKPQSLSRIKRRYFKSQKNAG